MGLVDYGSDSDDSDNERKPQPVAPKPATSSFLNLPPPKSSQQSTASTAPASSAAPAPAPTKKAKAPLRFVLDLPPPSAGASSSASSKSALANDDDEPPAKKPRFSLGGGGGGGGLAMMLPKPKNESVAPVKPERTLGGGSANVGARFGGGGGDEKSATSAAPEGLFVPYSLGKGKKVALPPPAAAAAPPAAVEEEEVDSGLDFFGLGSLTSSSASSAPSTSKSSLPTISSAPSISSAPPPPTDSKPLTTSSFGDAPTPTDPYPGFVQLPTTGQWVAKDQATYDLWVASLQGSSVPKGFEGMDGADMTEVDPEKERENWEMERQRILEKERPSKIVEDQKPKIPIKAVGGRAKSRHQLSALLSEARDNRAELEERIAQGRANRKSAGNKYGF